MSALALAGAPPATRPLRFLLTSPLWGVLAGVLLLLDPLVLDGRWAPPAAALVHVFTLGVLGNAMLGSLLQFLPVAAATPIPGANLAPWLHACLNAGLVLLVAGLYRLPGLLAPASVLLAAALLGIAVPTVPVLLRAGSQRLLRAGVGLALAMLTGTVLLGMLAAAVLGGHIVLPLDRLADGHASFGIGGWMLLLLGTVGATTVPMFQGTAAVPPRALKLWLATSAALLAAASVARLSGAPSWLPAAALAGPVLAFSGTVLWLQWHAPHRRNLPLLRFWRAGCLAVAAAALLACAAALDLHERAAVLAGVLGIGIGLPLLVNGMLLEIVAFITWVALRGRCPRGVRIPPVGRLLPDAEKHAVLLAHLGSALLLASAVAWPALRPAAGLALLASYALQLACLLRCLRRAGDFGRTHAHGTPQADAKAAAA